METVVTLSLHENYVQVIVRFYKDTHKNYLEYAFYGSNVVEIIKEPCTVSELKTKLETFDKWEDQKYKPLYLSGFKGHFSFTYDLIDVENITEFEVTSARFINKSRGGRNVSGGFKDKMFRKKIFMNLLNAVASKDVIKLNNVMGALYSIGG